MSDVRACLHVCVRQRDRQTGAHDRQTRTTDTRTHVQTIYRYRGNVEAVYREDRYRVNVLAQRLGEVIWCNPTVLYRLL